MSQQRAEELFATLIASRLCLRRLVKPSCDRVTNLAKYYDFVPRSLSALQPLRFRVDSERRTRNLKSKTAFWLSFHFSQGQHRKSRSSSFLGLSLLRNHTETLATWPSQHLDKILPGLKHDHMTASYSKFYCRRLVL